VLQLRVLLLSFFSLFLLGEVGVSIVVLVVDEEKEEEAGGGSDSGDIPTKGSDEAKPVDVLAKLGVGVNGEREEAEEE
jgi:hypothetical protein